MGKNIIIQKIYHNIIIKKVNNSQDFHENNFVQLKFKKNAKVLRNFAKKKWKVFERK